MVAIGKVVFTSREHIIALEPRGKGLLGVTLRYRYEVRKEVEYFDDIPDEKIPKDMLDLASHIVNTKAGQFDPSKFEDQYEDALKDLLKKKQEGKSIERPEQPRPKNVVNLMDALRRSVEESGAAGLSKAKGRASGHHNSSEKAEHPKRKKAQRSGLLYARERPPSITRRTGLTYILGCVAALKRNIAIAVLSSSTTAAGLMFALAA
jgi:DNA end-binding protein Ku